MVVDEGLSETIGSEYFGSGHERGGMVVFLYSRPQLLSPGTEMAVL